MKTLHTIICTVLFLTFSQIKGQDTFADNFQSISYSNNDGSQAFSGDWVETGETTTPASDPTIGSMTISGNRLDLLNLDFKYITRNLNLSAYDDVTLTLDYTTIVGDETINVQLFNGTNFVNVALLAGTGSISYALAANEISSQSAIRFVTASGGWTANYLTTDSAEYYHYRPR